MVLIYGKNSVISAINTNRVICIYISNKFNDYKIMFLVKKNNIKCNIVEINDLNKMVNSKKHQGIIAMVKEYQYYQLSELINDGKKKKNPIIIMLDQIEDPHNLGAILRIADAFNVLGVIFKKNNQVHLNATVHKVSTGAINYIKITMVSNINNTIIKLKKNGYLIISTDQNSELIFNKLPYDGPIVLIFGSEKNGISNLVKKNSDFVVKIPIFGHVNSLNVSNTLSIVLSYIFFGK